MKIVKMPLNEYNEDIKQARLKGHGEGISHIVSLLNMIHGMHNNDAVETLLTETDCNEDLVKRLCKYLNFSYEKYLLDKPAEECPF